MKSLKVGVTGGIGSGKTTVCKIFETLGVPVYYADDRAKKLMVENQAVCQKLISLFGAEAYLESGELNRAHLGEIVFSDKRKLEKLNAIVHPAVHQDVEEWHLKNSGHPYTLREAALLVENGSYQLLDKLIVVAAPENVRLERVMKRDSIGAEAVKARMSKQLPQSVKIGKADFVVDNDGAHLLLPQVVDIHRRLSESLKNIW